MYRGVTRKKKGKRQYTIYIKNIIEIYIFTQKKEIKNGYE